MNILVYTIELLFFCYILLSFWLALLHVIKIEVKNIILQ